MAGATTTPKSTAIVKSLGASLNLQSISELFQLAEILYKGGASNLPNVGSPNHVFHLLLHGMEIGLTHTQSLANLSMGKNGKPSIMGDAALALVLQSGLLEDIKEFWEGEGDNRKGVCIVKRKGFPDHRRFEFTTVQAETAGLIKRAKGDKGDGPWLAYRDRMLRYRPLGYAMRDVFPDVLKGMYLTEELENGDAEPQVVVKQLGATVDPPAASQLDAPAGQTASASNESQVSEVARQLPAANATPADTSGPVTDAQANEFRRLKKLVIASKDGLRDAGEIQAAWAETLSAYGVTSVAQLTRASAEPVIRDLIVKHDPFTKAGPSDPPTSTA